MFLRVIFKLQAGSQAIENREDNRNLDLTSARHMQDPTKRSSLVSKISPSSLTPWLSVESDEENGMLHMQGP